MTKRSSDNKFVLQSAEFFGNIINGLMERYRSGHNGADSKSAMYSDEVSVENPVVMRVFSL